MAGTLTKVGIASSLFIMIFVVFIFTMSTLGTEYGSSIEATYSFADYENQTYDATSTYQDLTQGASLDQQTTDSAQFQEKLSSEGSKVSFWGVIGSAMDDVAKIFPVHKIIWTMLAIIITIIGLAGVAYAFFGRTF